MLDFKIGVRDSNSRARTGLITVRNRVIETPAYVIVAANSAVRALLPEDLSEIDAQAVIVSTYNMWRDLGDEGLHDFPGLHEIIHWSGVIMTDSGAFQTFGLRPRITESGVYFKPKDSSEELYLDAEISIKIQEQLGGDIVVAFDQAISPTANYDYARGAMLRAHKWAERSLEAKESDQALYAIVQGGGYKDLRQESAKFIGSLPFDGFGIGNVFDNAYASIKEKTREMIQWSIYHLPEGKPKHLFGVVDIEDIFIGVEEGIDTFDCVMPIEEARRGGIWTSGGKIDIKEDIYAEDDQPLDWECSCPVCIWGASRSLESSLLKAKAYGNKSDFRYPVSRGKLYELFKSKSAEAVRFAAMHNVYFLNDLMKKMRDSIGKGNFQEFKSQYLKRLVKHTE